MKNSSLVIFMIVSLLSCRDNHKQKEKKENPLGNRIRRDTILNKEKDIDRIETYYDSVLTCVMFFKNKQLRKTIKYMKSGEKLIPNELYTISENGDTLKNESIYHVIYFMKDTVALNEKYNFKIVLEGHLFNNAFLALSDINAGFPTRDSKRSEVVKMINFESTGLSTYGKVRGWNYIRGRIDNVKDSIDFKEGNRWSSLYFIDSFYVK